MSMLDVTFEEIAKSLNSPGLTWLDKCALAREKTRALIAIRKRELATALRASEMGTDANVGTAAGALALYRDNYEFEIRNAYVNMFAALGQTVDSAQLDFVTDCSRQLDAFERQLQSSYIRPEFRERILGAVQKAFDRLYNKLNEMTKEIIASAERAKRP